VNTTKMLAKISRLKLFVLNLEVQTVVMKVNWKLKSDQRKAVITVES
jgi:hypothetical protein